MLTPRLFAPLPDRIRAISLWQPWASAVVCDGKRIETRHWPTNYRGLLLIHAATRCVRAEMLRFAWDYCWQAALGPVVLPFVENQTRFRDCLPFGAIVGAVDVTD